MEVVDFGKKINTMIDKVFDKYYELLKQNGVEVERKLISTDTYSPIAQIKKVALTEVF